MLGLRLTQRRSTLLHFATYASAKSDRLIRMEFSQKEYVISSDEVIVNQYTSQYQFRLST